MRYSIRALIVLTLLAAIVANVRMQRQRIVHAHAAIEEINLAIKQLNFDEAYVDSHTSVCELAIANNPLPSPSYLGAVQRLEKQTASGQEQRK